MKDFGLGCEAEAAVSREWNEVSNEELQSMVETSSDVLAASAGVEGRDEETDLERTTSGEVDCYNLGSGTVDASGAVELSTDVLQQDYWM